MSNTTIFYPGRHRRGVNWAALYERTGRPLNIWQTIAVGAAAGIFLGLIVGISLLA